MWLVLVHVKTTSQRSTFKAPLSLHSSNREVFCISTLPAFYHSWALGIILVFHSVDIFWHPEILCVLTWFVFESWVKDAREQAP